MTFGSLFAGIGGLDLGLERAGMRCVWQVEKDDYARRVLEKHWPDVRRHDDVCTFPPGDAAEWGCDLICGGFPCQPVARGGAKLREQDGRWLWPEFSRIICHLSPRFILLENTTGLLDGGMDSVFGSLAEMGFSAEWGVLSACMFGAPHTRERLFVVAHADREHGQARLRAFKNGTATGEQGNPGARLGSWLEPFSGIAGVANRVPARVDRLRCLGNAVVPQVAEWIGRRILAIAPLDTQETGLAHTQEDAK